MQDTLPQGVKSIHALLQRIKKYLQQALNNWHGIIHYNNHRPPYGRANRLGLNNYDYKVIINRSVYNNT